MSIGHFPLGISPRTYPPPRHFPMPGQFHGRGHFPLSPPTCANLYKAIYHNWTLALTRIPDPNRPTTWSPNPNPNPNRPTKLEKYLKTGTNPYSYPNRPTTWVLTLIDRWRGEILENWHEPIFMTLAANVRAGKYPDPSTVTVLIPDNICPHHLGRFIRLL